MRTSNLRSKQRRTFLKLTGAAVTMTAAPSISALTRGRVAVIVDDSDPMIASAPVSYAVEMLRSSLRGLGLLADGVEAPFRIVIATPQSQKSQGFGKLPGIPAPETVAILAGKDAVLVTGSDARGVMYGVLEMVDRVRLEAEPMAALHIRDAMIESSPNRVRSVLSAEIPGEYTQSPFPLQYYFELQSSSAAWLQPAFNSTLSNQPYFAISNRG